MTPKRGEAGDEVAGVLRWPNLQDEEKHRDGDDRIAERDDRAGFRSVGPSITARPSGRDNRSACALPPPSGLVQRQGVSGPRLRWDAADAQARPS